VSGYGADLNDSTRQEKRKVGTISRFDAPTQRLG
jgi:hypothetical protein